MPPKHKGLNMNSKSGSSANPQRNPDRVKQKGGNLRDKATINRINMYKGGKPIRDKKGTIVGGSFMMRNRAGDQPITGATAGRVAPDRRWFGNTRVIKQEELDRFREEMTTRSRDPYSVLLRRKKLPMGLLQESGKKVENMNLLETESYEDVLSKGRRRKRAKLSAGVNDLSGLLARAEAGQQAYGEGEGDSDAPKEWVERSVRRSELFEKGQSRRIWGELYKVLDCSDVVIQVLDARNVPGTRCPHLERHLKNNASHKHLVFVINKVDLVPTWVTKKWVKLLSADHPTLAFHASITNSFGKGALINLLRQFAKLHPDKKQISVGVVGYPNVGKSSIINTLKKKKVCKVAPIPGETKVWQYIALMRRIFVVDCPGVVYDEGDDETEIVLKGVVRAEKLPDPTDFVDPILARVKEEYLRRLYGISSWEDGEDFMTKLAKRSGRLLPGGEPDFHAVSVNLINDWQRGKLPYFVAPPLAEGETPKIIEAEPVVKARFLQERDGTGDAPEGEGAGEGRGKGKMKREGEGSAGDKGEGEGKEDEDEEDGNDLAGKAQLKVQVTRPEGKRKRSGSEGLEGREEEELLGEKLSGKGKGKRKRRQSEETEENVEEVFGKKLSGKGKRKRTQVEVEEGEEQEGEEGDGDKEEEDKDEGVMPSVGTSLEWGDL
ncbi:unnamed protein product [Discosporangium mesarthrocarpum]